MKFRVLLISIASVFVLVSCFNNLSCVQSKETLGWTSITKSKHFIYYREGMRNWADNDVMALLENAYSYYSNLFKRPLKYIITVEDRINKNKKPPFLSATNNITKDSSTIICTFPDHFGTTPEDKSLAFHFFTHELLHCWIGGHTKSHSIAVEALVQFQTDLLLSKLKYFPNRYVDEYRIKSKRILEGIQVDLSKYYVQYYKVYKKGGEEHLNRLLIDLENVFNLSELNSKEEIDVEPILKKYMGEDLNDLSKSNE